MHRMDGKCLPDPRLEALAAFTRAVVKRSGWVREEELESFVDAGFSRRHVLDVLTILAMKTLSNYTNHIAETPLDKAFSDQEWHGERSAA
jgi:alkylhydroperoxidase family enzyme